MKRLSGVLPHLRHARAQDAKYLLIAAVITAVHMLALPLMVVACVEWACWVTRKLFAATDALRQYQ